MNFTDPMGLRKIGGIDITKKYCGCQDKLKKKSNFSRKMQGLYRQAGQQSNIDSSDDVEDYVMNALDSSGTKYRIGGTYDPAEGPVVNPSSGKCGPIVDRANRLHEVQHGVYDKLRQKKYGAGTDKYDEVYDSASDWIQDEIQAYGTMSPFYDAVISELDKICCE